MNIAKGITVAAAASALLIAGAYGCKDWSAETAGRKIDNATAKAGEKMDKAEAKIKEKATTAEAEVKEKAMTAEAALGDAAITAKVKAALIGEPGLKALKIDVDTTNGKVVLNGRVDSPQSDSRAQEIARAVEGVKGVESHLMVGSTG